MVGLLRSLGATAQPAVGRSQHRRRARRRRRVLLAAPRHPAAQTRVVMRDGANGEARAARAGLGGVLLRESAVEERPAIQQHASAGARASAEILWTTCGRCW